MITTKAKKISIIAILYTLISGLILLVGWYITEQNKDEFAELKTKYAEAESARQLSITLEQILKLSQADRDTLQTFFIAERDTIHFITEVENIASELNINLETTQLAVDSATDKQPSKLKIGFVIDGDYTSVVAMLFALETMPYHLLVQTVTIKETKTNGWEGSIIMHVTLQ